MFICYLDTPTTCSICSSSTICPFWGSIWLGLFLFYIFPHIQWFPFIFWIKSVFLTMSYMMHYVFKSACLFIITPICYFSHTHNPESNLHLQYLFIQQIFIEYPIYDKYCFRHWWYSNKVDQKKKNHRIHCLVINSTLTTDLIFLVALLFIFHIL